MGQQWCAKVDFLMAVMQGSVHRDYIISNIFGLYLVSGTEFLKPLEFPKW